MQKKEILIELENVDKYFDGQKVIDNFNLKIYNNEFITLLGPSGCGKSTTINMIAGFSNPDKGKILYRGQDIKKLPAYLRPWNTVFQNYALFPHLNVFENIVYGPRAKRFAINNQLQDLYFDLRICENNFSKNKKTIKKDLEKLNAYKAEVKDLKAQIKKLKANDKEKWNKKYLKDEVKKLLQLLNMNGFENRKISELSGGQQQRIAIARALINKPKVLLLDEPLGALDLLTRKSMQKELKRLQIELGITFIYVTHDQTEALSMSDKVVVMKEGDIMQMGSPEMIYEQPINEWVASFIGNSNIIEDAKVVDSNTLMWDKNKYQFGTTTTKLQKGQLVDVLVRPEDIKIVKPGQGMIDGKVKTIEYKGIHFEVIIDTKEGTYLIDTTVKPKLKNVAISWNKKALHVMKPFDNSTFIYGVQVIGDDLVSWKGNDYRINTLLAKGSDITIKIDPDDIKVLHFKNKDALLVGKIIRILEKDNYFEIYVAAKDGITYKAYIDEKPKSPLVGISWLPESLKIEGAEICD